MFAARSLARAAMVLRTIAPPTAPLRLAHSCGGTMKALVLDAPGPNNAPMVLKDVPLPDPDGNRVRVRVAACGVCYRDVLDRKGAFPFIQKPTILGHEIAGVVDKLGPDCKGLRVGDRVVSLHWASCGVCDACRKGKTTECEVPSDFFALTANGGYAEYVVGGESAFAPVPPSWPSALTAAPVACTFGTVWHGAITRGQLLPGETVLITGASGGVGSSAVLIASKMGCRVLAVTTSAAKEEYLRGLGATEVLVSPTGNFSRHPAVKGGVDIVLECVGAPTFESSVRVLKRGGRVVLIGNVTVGQVPLKLGGAIINSHQIIGTDSCTIAELKQVFEFLTRTGISPDVSSVLRLEDVDKAHHILETKGVKGRMVIDVASHTWGGPASKQ